MKTKKLYPFKFTPLPQEKVWGGDILAKKYGKPFDPNLSIGESWEVFSINEYSPAIANGYLKGNSLAEILETYMGEVVGDDIYNYFSDEFPLLIKLLDMNQMLSVQVHPDDEIALERHNSYGKNEAWFVLEAKPEAKIYMGFNKDITATEFYQRCKDNTVTEVLNLFHPKAGDFFYVEAGTVHAAGDGVVIAEIQQASDITYRVYDWGRENDPQSAREMHLEEAIDCINYNKYTGEGVYLKNVEGVRQLTDNPYFTINHITLNNQTKIDTDLYDSFIIYFVYQGKLSIGGFADNSGNIDVNKGEFVLIPAHLGGFMIKPEESDTSLLEIYIRDIRSREDYPDIDPNIFYEENPVEERNKS